MPTITRLAHTVALYQQDKCSLQHLRNLLGNLVQTTAAYFGPTLDQEAIVDGMVKTCNSYSLSRTPTVLQCMCLELCLMLQILRYAMGPTKCTDEEWHLWEAVRLHGKSLLTLCKETGKPMATVAPVIHAIDKQLASALGE